MGARTDTGVAGTTEYPTTPLLLERKPKKNNILIGNDATQIRFTEQYLSMEHGVPIRHEAVPAVNDDMLLGFDVPKLYLVDRSSLIDISPKEKAKTGIWSLDLIGKDSAGINAIIRYAAKLIGIEKPDKDIVAKVGYELIKESDPNKKNLLSDVRAAVWQASWLLSGPIDRSPRWIAPWENWMLWMPKGDRDTMRYRLNTLYRELVMWVFAFVGDEQGVRKTGGRWDAKQFQRLSGLHLPKDKVYSTLAELSNWRTHDDYDPFVCAIRISKIWDTKK
jgi:hypothetical protein